MNWRAVTRPREGTLISQTRFPIECREYGIFTPRIPLEYFEFNSETRKSYVAFLSGAVGRDRSKHRWKARSFIVKYRSSSFLINVFLLLGSLAAMADLTVCRKMFTRVY